MKYNMKLRNEPFEKIKNGTKKIEIRLNDEKRQKINIGDTIIFTNNITKEVLKTKVIKINKFNNFEELYNCFDKTLLGYKKDEVASSKDMDSYYTKEEQEKYGVLGIEITPLKTNKKELIYNNDNISINDINRVVRRSKLLIETSNKEIMLCKCDNSYFFLGGHNESDETDMECLKRELLEESGVNIDFDEIDPFMTIKYLNKDYPEKGVNTFTMANYYSIKMDLIPDESKLNLTDDEKNNNFKIETINSKDILKVLNDSLLKKRRIGVTEDTIKVLKEYLSE